MPSIIFGLSRRKYHFFGEIANWRIKSASFEDQMGNEFNASPNFVSIWGLKKRPRKVRFQGHQIKAYRFICCVATGRGSDFQHDQCHGGIIIGTAFQQDRRQQVRVGIQCSRFLQNGAARSLGLVDP